MNPNDLNFLADKNEIKHYSLENNVDWLSVPKNDPVHVNGCGDTFAGSFIVSKSSGLSIESSIKKSLTAAQISLRSTQNIAISLL